MATFFNESVYVNNKTDLYGIQDHILVALTLEKKKIHFINGSHICNTDDRFGFLTNQMDVYKCILIPNSLRDEAIRFSSIIENMTGHVLHFFCSVCGDQNI